ncbi:MAG: hypothetical protein ACI9JY_002657 [Saprospiraceae bacterium]|jgi:hypothetical protein
MKKSFLFFLVIFSYTYLYAQKTELTYYLPDIQYDKSIPTPEEVLGYMPGDWHISHDQLVMYLKVLAAASDKVTVEEYARSYENRPLLLLTITSKKNHADIDDLRRQHVALTDPNLSAKIDVSKMPAVVYQGFSIHGNEPSGGNAAPLVAYYLAAGKSKEVEDLLDNTIILLDPCYNPDGFNRFSSWVNSHKSETLVSDPQDREYEEAWPRGRTNHYWFDLNRDWLPIQHPESRGRIKNFHHWKPNVLTDHHEMGSNATFFFQPGIPTRTNPLTPQKNQDLTFEIGEFHAAALDEIGSLYYTQESFDDFYYGKGSTYPDVNGSIGILFEQASSRGHLQETKNGLLSFPFTIRNQVKTALSTQKAAVNMRKKLLNYQREFYKTGLENAQKSSAKAYSFSDNHDPAKMAHFIDILLQHKIDVYQNKDKASEFIVPLEQPQSRLVEAIFGRMTTFQDSLFYDISAWTLPLAFNLNHESWDKNQFSKNVLGKKVSDTKSVVKTTIPKISTYAYLMEWEGYYAPKALHALQQKGLRTKVATNPFSTSDGKQFAQGTILLPLQNQALSESEIYELIQDISKECNVQFHNASTGLTPTGIDFGSRNFADLTLPKVMMIVGDGVTSYDAGEVWHLLDNRYHIPLTKIAAREISNSNLDKYNVIVMVNGSYEKLSKVGAAKIKKFVESGGTLITNGRAVKWANTQGLANVTFKSSNNTREEPTRRPYNKMGDDSGASVIGGAIFESKLDLTHPLAFGYKNEILPVFRRGTMFMQPTKNLYATPQVYTKSPLLSGYISDKNLNTLKESACIIVSGKGSGKVICMADNPNFRAFWYGTNKLFANAVFFGNIISSSGVQR